MAIGKRKDNAPKVGDSKFSGRVSLKGPKRTKGKAGANAYEQMGEQNYAESMANRDVHRSQDLRRGEEGKVRGYTTPKVAGILAGSVSSLLMWFLWGGLGWAFTLGRKAMASGPSPALEQAHDAGVPDYFVKQEVADSITGQTCYMPTNADGSVIEGAKCYSAMGEVPRPEWHEQMAADALSAIGQTPLKGSGYNTSLISWLFFGEISFLRLFVVVLVGVIVGSVVGTKLVKQRQASNALYDSEDINTYTGDQHIALPEEAMERYSAFPDVGAHCETAPSSLIGHAMISSRGLKDVKVLRRYDKDVKDADGNIEHFKGEEILDADGEPLFDMVPIIDEDFGSQLWDDSKLLNEKALRLRFDARKVAYNPGGKNRDKAGKQDNLAAFINEGWEFPEYEPQRPAGIYMVDEAPVNTMVLAMTRAGKGQTYIEPMIDMWLRELRGNNMVINDPKGELLVKNYVRAAKRGYQVVQFNLINPLKTDIYNPLAMAADAAREGDTAKTATYVENIAEVFFPVDDAPDPVWPSAANNAFKRTAYGMIDFYLEEEREIRKIGKAKKTDPKVIETKVDKMWGKVTLYNCYQFFVQLSAKKLKDPLTDLQAKVEAGEYGDPENVVEDQDRLEAAQAVAETRMPIWNGEQELDMLTLFFNATDLLPKNSMRDLVSNADKSLRAMGAAEKMLASVYGIAITAMSFFTDPTISTLTSGTLSQNVDLAGLSFPRRFGVRFDQNYVAKNHLVGAQVVWDAFSDPDFTEKLPDKLFKHEDTVGREGWARYYFDGKFSTETSYVRLRLFTNGTGLLLKTFYFRFTKDYQTNLRGNAYIKDPVNGTKIVKDGLLVELHKNEAGKFVPKDTTFTQPRLNISDLDPNDLTSEYNIAKNVKQIDVERPVIIMPQVRYSESPKAVFLVTPPHLMKYAKLILILVKQLVDLNFDKSYMTKSSQKPLYKTRFMLDELGKSNCKTLLTCNV